MIPLQKIYLCILFATCLRMGWGYSRRSASALFEAAWGCQILFVMAILHPGFSQGYVLMFQLASLLLFWSSYDMLAEEIWAGKHSRTVALAKWLAGRRKKKDK